jgi:division protein CdvB (Snf7/Vps24/ESCRT-III family)
MTETEVKLNVHELGVILSALQLLENTDENRIVREYGSVTALYDRLDAIWSRMDTSETGLRNDVVPSF